MRRIKQIGKTVARVTVPTPATRRLDPAEIGRALGAVPVDDPYVATLRRELTQTLRSSGGRPGIEGAELRPKIPMSQADWDRLEILAKKLATADVTPTPGQVASRLLHEALDRCEPAAAVPASRASEAAASYAVDRSWRAARRDHLRGATSTGETRAAASDRSITRLALGDLELLFTPRSLPIIDKGADAPTTSIAILGDAGGGKTTLAVALAHAIASELAGTVLFLSTELAPTEIKYKVARLALTASVVAWPHRGDARAGDVIGQHVALVDAPAGGDARTRALEAAWRLLDDVTGGEPRVRCVVIDALPPPDAASVAAAVREDVVSLVQAIESRGISVVVVIQDVPGAPDYIPLITDIVFELKLADDPAAGARARRLACLKSRYLR